MANQEYIVIGKTQSGTEIKLPKANITGKRSADYQYDKKWGSQQNAGKTYTLNTGDKTYTLNQDQVDWIRSAHKNSWNDAYAFDDEDQRRKAAGLVPLAYAQHYKNTNLDNWLLENDLPSTKYLEDYLEEYAKVRPEQIRLGNLKDEFYNDVATKMVNYELSGIYNDAKEHENGTFAEDGTPNTQAGSEFFKNAFFDVLNEDKYADLRDRYLHPVSGGGKGVEDFEDTVEWRAYQLKQAGKTEDAIEDFDGMPYVSYSDFMENYYTDLDRNIKAQKAVDDAMARTYGEIITDNRNAEASELIKAYAAVDNAFLGIAPTAKNKIEAEEQRLRDEGKEDVLAYAQEQRQKAADRAKSSHKRTQELQNNILGTLTMVSANDAASETENVVAQARANGYSDDEIAEAFKAAEMVWNTQQEYGTYDVSSALSASTDIVRKAYNDALNTTQEIQQAKAADADAIIDNLKKSDVDTSAISTADAQRIVLDTIEYDNGHITDESMQAAMDALVNAGASTKVMKSVTSDFLTDWIAQGVADNRETAGYADLSDLSTQEIVQNAIAKADAETRSIESSVLRERLEQEGFTDYEIDQALRRAGWSDTLNAEDEAYNYFVEVLVPRDVAAVAAENGVSETQVLGGMTIEEYANNAWNSADFDRDAYIADFERGKTTNVDLHKTHGEQIAMQFAAVVPRVVAGIASGAVNIADMATALVTDRTERWDVSKGLSEADAKLAAFGKSAGQDTESTVISYGSDIATEIVRMYALNAAGAGLSKAFAGSATGQAMTAVGQLAKATGTSSKGFSFMLNAIPSVIQSAPFILNAMGGYYAEAVEDGAPLDQAALYGFAAGVLEGGLEALSVDNWMTNRLGSKLAFGMNKGGRAALRQLDTGIRAVSLTSSAIGNALEEGLSYTASTLLAQGIYGSGRQLHLDEFSQQALMGGLIGLFGSASQLPQQSYARSLYEFMSENGYSAEATDVLLAEMRYNALSESRRAALSKKVVKAKDSALLSTENYQAALASIDQAVMARNAAQQKLADTEAKAESDIAAKQNAVNRLKEQINGLPTQISGDVALEQSRLQNELAKAQDALNKQIEASKQAVDSSRKDLENVELQSRRAIEKAQSDLDLHFVAMHNAFTPFMGSIMRSATKDNVQSATDTMNLLNDAMASVRAGEMPATASEAAGAVDAVNASIPNETQETGITTDYSDGISYVDVDELSQREAVELGEKLGVPVEFVDMPDGFSGEYIDGVIRINRRLPDGENATLVVLKHELTHYIEGSDAYNDFSDFVTTLAQRLNPDVNINTVYNGYKAEYAARGITLDDPAARREFVARFAQDKLLRDEKAIQMLVNERSGLAGRVLNWVRYQIEKMRLRGKKDAAALELLEAERLYAKAFREAGKAEPRRNDAESYADQGVNMQGQKSVGGLSWQEMIDKYGAKPAGKEPRVRDEAVPERVSEDQRVSDFLRSFVESDKATEAMVEDVKTKVESGDLGVYIPQTNSRTQQKARNTIASKSQTDAIKEFQYDVAKGRINTETIAVGMQLLTEASERGDTNTTLSILSDLCICATETGRALQTFSMLKELGGVGSAYYMQRVEDRLNSKYKNEIDSGKMLPIKIDGTLLKTLAEAKTADDVQNAEAAIAANLGAQLPLTFQQKMSNWRYFSMLANPTTHIRNMTGNALMGGVRSVKDVVATGLERAFVRDSANRTHAVYTKSQQQDKLDYAEESFNKHRTDLTAGGKYGFETFMKQEQRMFDNKLLNKAAQANFKALEDEDAIFLKTAYKDAMVQYMIAQNIDPASMTVEQEKAAVEWASDQALKATFRDASEVARLLNRFSNINAATKVIVEGVMPFKKTPINVAKRGIEYSPIGVIQGVYQLTAGVKSGKYTVAQGIDRLASGITGSALVVLGAFLAKLGVLRGQGEEDERSETFLQSVGEQAYSLNVGDISLGISGLAPATIPLFMGVSLYDAISSQESFDLSALVDVVSSSLDPLMEMSFMSSLNAALESYNQDGIGGALGQVAWNAASSYASQFVPTLTGKIGQFADPYTRTSKSDATSVLGGTLDSFLRSVVKKVPIASSFLEPSVNVTGEVQEKTAFSDWAIDFLNKFVSPATIKVKDRDRVDEEIIRLYESTGETDFIPSNGRKYFTDKGERYEMDAQMYTAYSQDRGESCYAAIKKIIGTSSYKNASDANKSKMLSKAVKNAVDAVNDRYKEKLGMYD